MNWDDIRYFLALARIRTVSGAGKELGVKHTTVARRIQALEEDLKTRLFARLPNGYALTQAGEDLYQYALVMEQQTLAVHRQVFGQDAQLHGSLKLTAANDVLSRLVIPHLASFSQAYPGVDLQLSSSVGLADLSARQADIALRLTPEPPDYLIGTRVLPLSHGLYVSTEYQKKYPKTQHLLLWSDSGEKPDWAKQYFPDATVAIRANDITSLLSCVCNHLGVARLPCYIGDSDPNLRRLDFPLVPSTWGIWVLSHVDLRATAKVRACRDFLVDVLKQQAALIGGLNSRY